MTTPGKYRHLAQSSTPTGHFNILAIDHRANLLSALNKHVATALTDEQFANFKREIIQHLLPHASAVLTDPIYAIGTGIAEGFIGGQVGLLAPLEVTNYDVHPSQRMTEFIENWSVARIKRIGGSGVKLLLYYHPGDKVAAEKHDLVRQIVDQCERDDIPFFLEPIAYSLDAQKNLDNNELRQVVVESARTFSEMGVDVLKLEFPVNPLLQPDEQIWHAAAQEVNAACSVPWAVLSAGVDYATFLRQAVVACQAGASGVIVGRAIWSEAVQLQGEARTTFLTTTARERMQELGQVCTDYARSWKNNTQTPDVSLGWHEHYSE